MQNRKHARANKNRLKFFFSTRDAKELKNIIIFTCRLHSWAVADACQEFLIKSSYACIYIVENRFALSQGFARVIRMLHVCCAPAFITE